MTVTASILPDPLFPEMYRIRYPDGTVSDMLNSSRIGQALADFVGKADAPTPGRREDRAHLLTLLTALNASDKQLRRDDSSDWHIKGHAGHIYADGAGFLLVVGERSARAWTFAKRRMTFCACHPGR